MIVYVAGPYRGDVDRNIKQAREIAIEIWESGNVALCPHLNTAHFEVDCCVPDDVYLKGDYELLARCDAIVMTPDWENSQGASLEHAFATVRHIPIYYYPDLPKPHPTEIKSPSQVRGFIDTVMDMYRVHLDKNADYSPANILGTGEIGLVTRLWDKIARLLNLMGFRITISGMRFEQPKEPKHESIDDTLMDAAVYSIIGLLLRKGQWGR